MGLELPPVALALLAAARSVVEPTRRGSRAQLLASCKAHGYALHPSVAAFEAAFGGLVIPDSPKQRRDEPLWLFGAYACLGSGAHVAPRGGSTSRGLVPVVYSPNDVIYFLDKRGRAYAQDTLEDSSAKPFAASGKALVTRIMLYSALFALGESSQAFPGLVGAALAKRLSLRLVKAASDEDLRFYSDARAKTLVVENLKATQTLVVSANKRQVRSLLETVEAKPVKNKAKVAKSTPPKAKLLQPFAGKASVRVAWEKRTELPDVFEHLPLMSELDASGNKLQSVPDSLWRAPALKELDLGHNPLTSISDAIVSAKLLRSLSLRACPITSLPAALAGLKNLEKLWLTECDKLDIDAALLVIAQLPKLKSLGLPLSRSLTTLAPLAKLPLRSLVLAGTNVPRPKQLPAGLGQLQKLTDLRIDYADDVANLPKSPKDVRALRLLFHKRFSDDDIRKSVQAQPEKKYLAAFAKTLARSKPAR